MRLALDAAIDTWCLKDSRESMFSPRYLMLLFAFFDIILL